MVFDKDEWFSHPYGDMDYFPDAYPVKRIAELIWDDVEKQIPNNRNIIMSKMHNILDYDDFKTPANNPLGYDYDWEVCEEANKQTVLKFMEENKNCFFYCFEYHDDNGEPGGCGCAMEHGDLYHRLSHLISSNH